MGKKTAAGRLLAGLLLGVLAALWLAGCGSGEQVFVREDTQAPRHKEEKGALPSRYRIYLVTMDLESIHWQRVDAGCRQAAMEIGGIDYKWLGPDRHDGEQQSRCIDQAVAEGAQAILVAAASKTAIVDSLRKADEAGVKIIYVDSPADYDCVATVGTDNEAAGRKAAETMRQALAERGILSGTIGIVVNKVQTTSTSARERGFRERLAGAGYALAPTIYMNDDPQRVKQAVKERPDYAAFFGASERTTQAVGEQVKEAGTGQLVIGFDASDAILALVSEGYIYAVMQQNPKAMGYDGMELAVQALAGTYAAQNDHRDVAVNVLTRDKV